MLIMNMNRTFTKGKQWTNEHIEKLNFTDSH